MSSSAQDERNRKLNKLRAERSRIVRTQEYDNPSDKVLVFKQPNLILNIQVDSAKSVNT